MDVLFGFAANTFRSAAYSADGADRGMALIELASGVTLDEVAAKTQANYRVVLS